MVVSIDNSFRRLMDDLTYGFCIIILLFSVSFNLVIKDTLHFSFFSSRLLRLGLLSLFRAKIVVSAIGMRR